MEDKIAIVVLAAGESKRLGQAKQLLQYEGETLLGGVLKEMSKVKVDGRYVVLGSQQETIANKVDLDGWKIITNSYWSSGMGKSLATAISHLKVTYDYVTVILGDQYRISADYVNKLIKKRKVDAILLTHNGTTSSPPALWPQKYFLELCALNDDNGARMVVRKHLEKVLTISCTAAKYDVDMVHDVTEWRRWKAEENLL